MDIEEHLKDMHWEWGLNSFLVAADNISHLKKEAEKWQKVSRFLAGLVAKNNLLGENTSTEESVLEYVQQHLEIPDNS